MAASILTKELRGPRDQTTEGAHELAGPVGGGQPVLRRIFGCGDARSSFRGDAWTGWSAECRAAVEAAGNASMGRYDALYVPRDSAVRLRRRFGLHLAEVSAPVTGQYPLQFVSFADVLRPDPAFRHRRPNDHADFTS